jgi:hypothetical protein
LPSLLAPARNSGSTLLAWASWPGPSGNSMPATRSPLSKRNAQAAGSSPFLKPVFLHMSILIYPSYVGNVPRCGRGLCHRTFCTIITYHYSFFQLWGGKTPSVSGEVDALSSLGPSPDGAVHRLRDPSCLQRPDSRSGHLPAPVADRCASASQAGSLPIWLQR